MQRVTSHDAQEFSPRMIQHCHGQVAAMSSNPDVVKARAYDTQEPNSPDGPTGDLLKAVKRKSHGKAPIGRRKPGQSCLWPFSVSYAQRTSRLRSLLPLFLCSRGFSWRLFTATKMTRCIIDKYFVDNKNHSIDNLENTPIMSKVQMIGMQRMKVREQGCPGGGGQAHRSFAKTSVQLQP
ncbi:hypothetical protein VTN77DRAFT_407 [Rasamsonia byssochlamydoides]|uniref:uncharacterized protein n=1 Tax=Rasamsonia byssochlamydoides TaxID=89139 RepID=UPI00374250AE